MTTFGADPVGFLWKEYDAAIAAGDTATAEHVLGNTSSSDKRGGTLREAAGLTQADVARHAQVQDRTARRWESTHEAPLVVQEWVRDCWREVRGAARVIADQRAGDAAVMLSRTPTGWDHGQDWTAGMDAAVTRLALALLELDGAEVTVAG